MTLRASAETRSPNPQLSPSIGAEHRVIHDLGRGLHLPKRTPWLLCLYFLYYTGKAFCRGGVGGSWPRKLQFSLQGPPKMDEIQALWGVASFGGYLLTVPCHWSNEWSWLDRILISAACVPAPSREKLPDNCPSDYYCYCLMCSFAAKPVGEAGAGERTQGAFEETVVAVLFPNLLFSYDPGE